MKTLPMMSFGEAVKTCFKKYVTFSGRARRSEYWWFALLNIILGVCSTLLVNWKLGKKSELESQIVEAAFDQDKYNELLAQAKLDVEAHRILPESRSKVFYSHALQKLQSQNMFDVSYAQNGRKHAKYLKKSQELSANMTQLLEDLSFFHREG